MKNQDSRNGIIYNILYYQYKMSSKKLCKDICTNPLPPRLPRNFTWSGRYIVPDLGMNVPFTWTGNHGNIQMIAGSIDYPIWFTNFILGNCLYTYTYKWPGLTFHPNCEPLPFSFSIDDLNTLFASSVFVGPEILDDCLRVNHFRLSIVLQLQNPGPGAYLRLPVASADIYTDRDDSTKIVRILHFGLHNLYDPNLDEWIYIDNFCSKPGDINIPPMCKSCTTPSGNWQSRLESYLIDKGLIPK